MGGPALDEDAQELVAGFGHAHGFWSDHDMSDPKLINNPLSKVDLTHCLPMAVHGDGGAFQRHDSITVISMRSLLSSANVAHSQLLLAAIPKYCSMLDGGDDENTMHHIWSILKWSFSFMLYNKHPEKDHNGNKWPPNSKRADLAGQPLSANGFSACVFAMTGDGEWFQNEYKLKGASSNECCFNCQANRSDIPYNDFRASAAWRKTVTKHKGKCPTSHVISGVVGETFAYDSLHIIEEGVAAHAIANCFFDWVIKPRWAGVQEARLKALFHKILKQYEELGIPSSNRIPKLTFSNFCNPKSKS
ncbi:unnamed protein product [Effrenium voratum]|nr:unnamed protein product [Effrenium voratum]